MKPERWILVLAFFVMLLTAGNVHAQPQSPVLSVTNGSWVCLSWSEIQGATGYYLSFAPMPYTGPESVITLDMGTRTSVSGELPAGSAYYAAVQSHDESGFSAFSNIVSIIIGSYPIASDVFTTLQETVSPIALPPGTIQISPADLTLYEIFGYSTWQKGPGLKINNKRTDIMPAGYSGTSTVNTAGLLHFFTMTDIHLTDKESPAQGIFFGWIAPFGAGTATLPAYSPVIAYSTQVLDAAVQTVNALNNQNAFDFGIFLGDAINNTQHNELRWYVDILDGKEINPGSGDHIGAGYIDYQKPYRAAGLNKSIPWYQVIGNHDQFFLGAYLESDYIRSIHVGDTIINYGIDITIPPSIDNHGYYMGVVDGSTPDGVIRGEGPEGDFYSPPMVAPDPNRRSLSTTQISNNEITGSSSLNWMKEFFNTTSYPAGHGFTQANIDKDFACYTFEPKSNMPVRVLVFDDTCKADANPQFPYYSKGCIDQARYEWLVGELDKGQADGMLMIIAAHVPVAPQTSIANPTPENAFYSPPTPDPHSIKTDDELLATLHNYPNLLLWIAGHRHMNTITAQKSPDPSHPENGFWEVETASLRDFPQQFRTFNIVRNCDNTISIIAVDVDPAVKDGSIAELSRSSAIGIGRILGGTSTFTETASQVVANAELVKQLTPEMQAKIANYGSPITASLDF